MTSGDETIVLSPTVVKVLDRFVEAMRADGQIDNDAIRRFEEQLRQGIIPKDNEIHTILFSPPPDKLTESSAVDDSKGDTGA